MVVCERLCIPFNVNKMVDEEEPFLGFFLSLHLNNVVYEWDIAEITFPYQNITSANFQQGPYSHLSFYHGYINKYINI